MSTLHSFLCEKPLEETFSARPSQEESIPITFCKRLVNCQVEEESHTISHMQAGRAFAIVDQNLNESCNASQFFAWKVRI